MKSAISSYLFVALSLLTLQALAAMPPQSGEKAPDWILSTADGERISLYADSEGQQAVIIFWASWCPYCAKLMPELEKLRRELNQHDIAFYALNVWEEANPKAYLKKHDLNFKLLMQAEDVAQRYGVGGTPGLFVTDAEKNITYIRMPGTSNEEAIAAVKAALGVAGPKTQSDDDEAKTAETQQL